VSRWHLPPYLRILVIPGDDTSTREYHLSRRLLVVLTVLLAALSLLFVLVVLSYTSLLGQVREVGELRRELLESRRQLAKVQELNRELEEMRDIQEKVLAMLGVAPPESGLAAADTATSLQDLAAEIMTPLPDHWPLRGFVTREFEAGAPARGVLPHEGIDLVAPVGTPIRTAGPGVVQQAGWDDDLGNYVEIRHGFGYVTVYGHCQRLLVATGDRVDAGQEIATLGGTGAATAPHLHFEVWKDGQAVDPRNVIPGDPTGAPAR